MEVSGVREKIRQAIEIVNDVEPTYRGPAFQVVLEALLRQAGVPPSAAASPVGAVADLGQLNEFLARLNLRSLQDTIEAILYHGLRSGVAEEMTREAIIDALARARRPRPKNPWDAIGKCVRRGHLVDAPEPKDGDKAWQITPSGERYVEGLVTTQ
jgi:hypothetical protein